MYYALNQTTDNWMSEDVKTTSTLLTNLDKFTAYKVQVAAFTIKGHGPKTQEIVRRTSEDG